MRRLALLLLCSGIGTSVAVAQDSMFEPLKGEPAKADPAPKAKKIAPAARRAHASARHRMIVTKAPPAIRTSAPSFYIGFHGGAGWSKFSSGEAAQSLSASGVLGGGQIGFNYQIGNFVSGVEADISASDIKGDIVGTLGGTPITGSVKHKWLATVAARFGHTYGRTLPYIKVGGAWTRYEWNFDAAGLGSASSSESRSGWMVGAGFEQALDYNWSAKVEYNYMDFGARTETLTTTGALVAVPTDIRLDAHVVKFGLNHRFTSF